MLLTGEIDLSLGSIMSLSLVIGGSSSTTVRGRPRGHGARRACARLVNGFAVGYGRINSLIMTLGTLSLYGGLAGVVARGQAKYLFDAEA